MHTRWHMNVKKIVGICLKRLRSRVMPRNTSEKANMLMFRLTRGQLSPLDGRRSARGYPTIVNNIQPCPKRWLLMPLVRIGVRTDSTTRYSYNAWPISAHAHWHNVQYAPTRLAHFSAFTLHQCFPNVYTQQQNACLLLSIVY